MKKILVSALLLSTVVFFFTACQSSTSPAPPSPASTALPAEKAMSGREHLEQAKLHLKEAKAVLEKEGAYDCCIKPECDWCALKEGACPCEKQVKGHKPVCPDCKFGWEHGKGHVEGIKPEDVTTSLEHSHSGVEEHGKREHKH